MSTQRVNLPSGQDFTSQRLASSLNHRRETLVGSVVQARSDSSQSHCSAPPVRGVPSLACTCQFIRSACVRGQPWGVKPDRQCLARKRVLAGDGEHYVSELHGRAEANDPTRMANSCESSTEPSLASTGLRQLSAPAKTALQWVIPVSERDAVPQPLPGERRSLNGELMRFGERGNPDHSPAQQHRAGRQTARGADGCGEWEDARSEWLPVMGSIPVETSPAGATLADVHLVYERKKSR